MGDMQGTMISAALAIGSCLCAPYVSADPTELSDSGVGIEDDGFRVGGSCATLAYLGARQLRETMKQALSDERHSFCFPEELSDCSDYNGLLRGLGRLSMGEDGYHCNLQLQY